MKREHNIKVVAIITIAAAVFMVILGLLYYVCKRMKKSRGSFLTLTFILMTIDSDIQNNNINQILMSLDS